jgi:serine/threonine kinase 38
LHWRKTFVIPPEANLSPAATDILKRLIADSEVRLGRNGVEEIKNHPFFEGMDWSTVRNQQAPYQPNVTSEISTENFDKFDEEEPFFVNPNDPKNGGKRGGFGGRKLDMNFIGYTYKADVENEKSMLVNVLKDLDAVQETQSQQQ